MSPQYFNLTLFTPLALFIGCLDPAPAEISDQDTSRDLNTIEMSTVTDREITDREITDREITDREITDRDQALRDATPVTGLDRAIDSAIDGAIDVTRDLAIDLDMTLEDLSMMERDLVMRDAGCSVDIEICDGEDNDCDGLIDEASVQAMSPLADRQQGLCAGARKVCVMGIWTEPDYQLIEGFQDIERCRNLIDDNCDGVVDEPTCQGACGDGFVDLGEECDQGSDNTLEPCPYGDPTCERCSTDCRAFEPEYCGDGSLNGPETCEVDQLEQGILCTYQCQTFTCGVDLSYSPHRIQGWPVCVHDELITQNPALYQQVVDALDEDLEYIVELLPEGPSAWLKRVNIWVELSTDQFRGAVYHPSSVWLTQNGYPPEWALGVQIGDANNYMTWVREQPAIILHELTHAWHHQYLTYSYAPLINAYRDAMDEGIYDSVQYVYGQYLEAYAASNVQEYFAEITEAWFWSNDYYPFIRSELMMHDPEGALVVESAWQMD